MSTHELAIVVVVAAAILYEAVDELGGGAERESEREAIVQAYKEGEIGEAEMERRLDLVMDPRNDKIREAVEEVNGVGPGTSAAIAVRFADLDDVAAADREQLEEIPGVGPDLSAAIVRRFEGRGAQ